MKRIALIFLAAFCLAAHINAAVIIEDITMLNDMKRFDQFILEHVTSGIASAQAKPTVGSDTIQNIPFKVSPGQQSYFGLLDTVPSFRFESFADVPGAYASIWGELRINEDDVVCRFGGDTTPVVTDGNLFAGVAAYFWFQPFDIKLAGITSVKLYTRDSYDNLVVIASSRDDGSFWFNPANIGNIVLGVFRADNGYDFGYDFVKRETLTPKHLLVYLASFQGDIVLTTVTDKTPSVEIPIYYWFDSDIGINYGDPAHVNEVSSASNRDLPVHVSLSTFGGTQGNPPVITGLTGEYFNKHLARWMEIKINQATLVGGTDQDKTYSVKVLAHSLYRFSPVIKGLQAPHSGGFNPITGEPLAIPTEK